MLDYHPFRVHASICCALLLAACGGLGGVATFGTDDQDGGTSQDGSEQNEACTTPGMAIDCTTSCLTVGVTVCGVDGIWGPCIPPDETCDGKDNDCDQAIDEDPAGAVLARPCNCGNQTGNETCENGVWGPCSAGVESGAEECDGKDNNCNSLVDEGCDDDGDGFCDAAIAFVGPVAVCPNGAGDCDDTIMAINPGAAETCDNKDNNCDGEIDNGLEVLTCGLGACKHDVASCVNGAAGICDPMEGASAEICDDKDNDCDGEINEGVADCCEQGETMDCGLDEGLCKKGQSTCDADRSWGTCEGGVEPTAEQCNATDDDCDGVLNNNTVGSGQACYKFNNCAGADCKPIGECLPGTVVCKAVDGGASEFELVCDGSTEPVNEVCDDKDNDCDGDKDEGLAVDEHESNNDCTNAKALLPDTGLATDSDPFTINATIYTQDGAPDEDWFTLTAKETSDWWPPCGLSFNEPCLAMEIAVVGPEGLPLEFCLYDDGCEAEKLIGCTTPGDPFMGIGWHNTLGLNANMKAFVQVFNKEQKLSCQPYLLSFYHYSTVCPVDGKCPWEEGYVEPGQ